MEQTYFFVDIKNATLQVEIMLIKVRERAGGFGLSHKNKGVIQTTKSASNLDYRQVTLQNC